MYVEQLCGVLRLAFGVSFLWFTIFTTISLREVGLQNNKYAVISFDTHRTQVMFLHTEMR